MTFELYACLFMYSMFLILFGCYLGELYTRNRFEKKLIRLIKNLKGANQ